MYRRVIVFGKRKTPVCCIALLQIISELGCIKTTELGSALFVGLFTSTVWPIFFSLPFEVIFLVAYISTAYVHVSSSRSPLLTAILDNMRVLKSGGCFRHQFGERTGKPGGGGEHLDDLLSRACFTSHHWPLGPRSARKTSVKALKPQIRGCIQIKNAP